MPLPKGPGLNLRRACVERQLMIVLMRSIEAEAVPRFPTLSQLTSRDSILVIWPRNDAGGSYEVHFSSKNSENNLELPNAIRLIPATSELFKLNTPRGNLEVL
jgi:hypothetical protein